MKQVFKSNLGITVQDVPLPALGDKQVLIQVQRSLISTGTETSSMKRVEQTLAQKISKNRNNLSKLNQYFKDQGFSAAKQKLMSKIHPSTELEKLQGIGYSVSGIIVEVGRDVKAFKVGDRVAASGSGFASHAEYVAVPINLIAKMPDNVSFEQAAFTTVGCIALHGIRRAELQISDTVVIVGLGLLGLLAVQIAKANGLKVIGIDLIPEKLELAQKLGADLVYNAADSSLNAKVSTATHGVGADAAIIYAASKSASVINQAMQFCRKKGKVILVGDVAIDIQRENMYEKEIDLLMSTSYGPGRYDDQYELEGVDYPLAYVKWTENRNMQSFLALVSERKIRLNLLISQEYPVDEAKSAFEFLVQKPNEGIGVLLKYGNEKTDADVEKHRVIANPSIEAVSGKISVAFIGCGSFIQRNHLPNIHKQKQLFHIQTICDVSPATLKLLERKYKPQKITSDYQSVLSDPAVDLVVIGTRHDLHGKLVIESLQAGKHVLVEKPLCISMQELAKIQELYPQKNKQLMVGFNRRFSPLTQEIKDSIKSISTPKFIIYRVNAGHIPKSVWIQDLSIGGGRIIGECCHFIDYIKYLVNKPISSYSFSSVPAGQNGIEAADNLSINISFEDGSLGVLQYIAIGNTKLAKERVEVHFANKSIVLDDFKALSFFGINKKDIRFKEVHKGFFEEMTLFAQAINSGRALIEAESIIETTEMTIKIQEELNG